MAKNKAPSLAAMLAEIHKFSTYDRPAREQLHRRVESMIGSGLIPKPLEREINSSDLARQQIRNELVEANTDPLWDDKYIEIPSLEEPSRRPPRRARTSRIKQPSS
jgi:hypothetical protein